MKTLFVFLLLFLLVQSAYCVIGIDTIITIIGMVIAAVIIALVLCVCMTNFIYR